MSRPLVGYEFFAEKTGCHVAYIRTLRRRHPTFPAVVSKVGKKLLFDAAAAREYIRGRTWWQWQ